MLTRRRLDDPDEKIPRQQRRDLPVAVRPASSPSSIIVTRLKWFINNSLAALKASCPLAQPQEIPPATGAWIRSSFATSIVFQRQSDLQANYERLTRTAIHTVKPDNIHFPEPETERQLPGCDGQPVQYAYRADAIKHTMAPVSIQDVGKVPADPADLNHGTECLLLQALPRGRTQRRNPQHGLGRDEEDHLQPGSAAGTPARG